MFELDDGGVSGFIETSYSADLVVRFNARKGIRERRQIAGSGVELPTIPAIR